MACGGCERIGPVVTSSIDGIILTGNWCFVDGRRLSIQGSDLVTPGVKRLTGEYDRHAFAYVASDGEAGAGATVYMVLIDDDAVLLGIGAAPSVSGEGEIWRRRFERIR